MAFAPFQQIQTADREKTLIQQNAARSFQSLQASTIGPGVVVATLLQSALPAGTDFSIQHNLERLPLGRFALITSSSGVFTLSPTANASPLTTDILRCSAAIPGGTTLSFWVF